MTSIRFEVVPGVTSAVAAPAFAGIPVTHRAHASAVTVVTASGVGAYVPPAKVTHKTYKPQVKGDLKQIDAAVSLMARDRGDVRIAHQLPLYPMLDKLGCAHRTTTDEGAPFRIVIWRRDDTTTEAHCGPADPLPDGPTDKGCLP